MLARPQLRPCAAALAIAAAAVLVACGRREPAQQPPLLPVQAHDFGVIPHGKAAQHDFVLDTHKLPGAWVAVGVSADCTCSRSLLFLRDRDGRERPITGQPRAEFAARPDEVLVVRTQIDSAQKEPADLGPVESKAYVLLQPLDERDAAGRMQWPLLFRYTIDSPVLVKPYAVLDFGSVPRSQIAERMVLLQSDLPGPPAHFGPARCDDPRVAIQLEPDGGRVRVTATFTAKDSPLEPWRALVTIDSDLPDHYQVKLAAVGTVVDDLEVVPSPTLTLRCNLQQEQPAASAGSQYRIVTDHDASRPAEFVVARFVDAQGRPAGDHFEVRFTAIPGDERSRRVHVRCLGGLSGNEFRGELVLAKDAQRGPFLTIQVIAFASQSP